MLHSSAADFAVAYRYRSRWLAYASRNRGRKSAETAHGCVVRKPQQRSRASLTKLIIDIAVRGAMRNIITHVPVAARALVASHRAIPQVVIKASDARLLLRVIATEPRRRTRCDAPGPIKRKVRDDAVKALVSSDAHEMRA